ncbi:MAG: AAA family ATPase [Bryobacteraceae bacterium]|nr:AAA family ATPase [Bryobacteraceae bacterium]
MNGSGKSTALRALAWALDDAGTGFDQGEWWHLIKGRPNPRVALFFGGSKYAGLVAVREVTRHASINISTSWVERMLGQNEGFKRRYLGGSPIASEPNQFLVHRYVLWHERIEPPPLVAAYAPSRALKHLEKPNPAQSRSDPRKDALAFESTVSNEAVQAWLVGLFSKSAIAAKRRRSPEVFDQWLTDLDAGLSAIFKEEVHIDVDYDTPAIEPRVRLRGEALDFSQLPDGVRVLLGWLADFMNRLELAKSEREGVLLIDEVDAHLHPRWQRCVLPALRAALPKVQIIVTTHSPFVITSCREARVHVLERDGNAKFRARPPVDAPFGQSINATMKDIFDVESKFDPQTEEELNEWNRLKRLQAARRLRPDDARRLDELTRVLSERSEELRLIVGAPDGLASLVGGVPESIR